MPPTVVGHPRQPEVALDGALHAEGLLDEVGDPVPLVPQELLEIRVLGDQLEGRAE